MNRRKTKLGLSDNARRIKPGETHYDPFNKGQQSKPKRHRLEWSHQHDLGKAIGKRIRVGFTARSIEGHLIAADQFTLKVRIEEGGEVRTLVWFKSAIAGFEVLEDTE